MKIGKYLYRYNIELKIEDNDENTDEEILSYNPHLRNNLIKTNCEWNEGCCFNYALNNINLFYLEDSYEYVEDNFEQIPISQAQKGDIVLYFDGYNELKHLAKIIKTKGRLNNTIIRSKWGMLGVYETKINELPINYGCQCEIWREKRG